MMNQQDIDELTEVFVEESQEILENLDKDVLELERYVGTQDLNKDLLNNIFRYVHTLKGNSGLAGADKLRDLAHKMESLLDRLRKEKMALTSAMVDVLFGGIDRIKSILQEVISGGDQGVTIGDLVGKLDAILSGKPIEAQSSEAGQRTSQPSEKRSVPQPPLDIPELTSVPDEIKRVLTEYEESRFIENIEKKFGIYEVILNLVMEEFERIVAIVITHLNVSSEVIAKVPSSKTAPGYDLQVRIIFASELSKPQLSDSLSTLDILKKQQFALNVLLTTENAKISPAAASVERSVIPEIPFKAEKPSVPEISVTTANIPTPEVTTVKPSVRAKPRAKPKSEPMAKTSPAKEFVDQSSNTVRVDIKKLDNLMNIVGELVLAKARYLQFESELEGVTQDKVLRENLKKNNKSTSKKLEDLREAILQVRMVQVGNLFNRFPRIVRDLAKDNEKRIQLIREGEETELDKAVVDEMGEPLIHLVRNAADHGIEAPQIRQQHAKPEVGTITLRAYQEGSYIVIEIQDDGAGLDVNRIRDKAIETGLIEKGAKLSDNEILNFIFHPGFSTAQKVTNTSGRGVGMDSVKAAITRLKGIIDIQTELTVGTKFIVKLPLTLAIIQVLLIRMKTHTYAIPLSTVTESFKLNPEKVEIVDGQEVTQLRDLVLPLLRLRTAFNLGDDNGHLADDIPGEEESLQERSFVVVIGLAEKKIGLIVDQLLEQQEIVIKPLGRYLLQTPGFAGATTLGDGRVVLILDVMGLIENINAKYKIGIRKQPEKSVVPV